MNWLLIGMASAGLVAIVVILVVYKTLVKKIFKDCHTGADNLTYDWVKVNGSGSVIVYNIMCMWHLRDDDIFDPFQFATGLSIIIAAVCTGGAIKTAARSMTTPNTPQQ